MGENTEPLLLALLWEVISTCRGPFERCRPICRMKNSFAVVLTGNATLIQKGEECSFRMDQRNREFEESFVVLTFGVAPFTFGSYSWRWV